MPIPGIPGSIAAMSSAAPPHLGQTQSTTNVEGSRLARVQRQPAPSPTDRPYREDTLLCHEQGGIDQISRVRLLGIACTEIWHGSNAGHSSGVAGVDAGRATPPDPRLARWGLARCCQFDPSYPALLIREDPAVEPCLIPGGPSWSLSRLPAWPGLRSPPEAIWTCVRLACVICHEMLRFWAFLKIWETMFSTQILS